MEGNGKHYYRTWKLQEILSQVVILIKPHWTEYSQHNITTFMAQQYCTTIHSIATSQTQISGTKRNK